MRQQSGFSNWYRLVCAGAILLAFDHAAWAQLPNETYDFSITKGIVEFGRGHYEQAAAFFEQARQAVPDDPEASEYLGQVLLRLKRFPDAEALFQDLTIRHPTHSPGWGLPSHKVNSGNITRRWDRLRKPRNSIRRILSFISIRESSPMN